MSELSEDRRSSVRRIAEQDYALGVADAAERVKIQWGIADAFLKALVLANGGAMVALFTLVGSLGKKDALLHVNAMALWMAFIGFVAGLTLTLLAHFFAFLSQHQFLHASMESAYRAQASMIDGESRNYTADELNRHKMGNIHYAAGLGAALLGVLAFVGGCGAALWGLLP